jgi:predicted O-linked N-acetylglucosamine transferase (SPINDLY family)
MGWTMQNGEGSAIVTLDPSHILESEREDTSLPLLTVPEDPHDLSGLAAALPVYQQVMGLDRDASPAMIAAGLIQYHAGNVSAAEWLLKRSIKVAPTVIAHNNLGHILLGRRQWDESIQHYRRSLEIDPTNLTTWPNLLFALDLHPGATWQLRLAERRRFNELHCKALTEAAAPHMNDPDPDRVLRVGYVSADYKQHSAVHGFGPVLGGHHAGRVELHLYDVDQEPPNPKDQISEWLRNLEGAVWHDVRGYDDATLVATIRADGIDILVDLSGYSGGGRPLMFARRPAPIQVSGFGYATGLGIDAMDYIVGDATIIPERHENRYHERVMRLPCFMAYEPGPPWPEIGPPPRERNGYTTYGYLGRVVKISPQTLATWAEILLRDPTAHMLLKGGEYKDDAIIEQIAGALGALGIERDRLEFRLGSSRPEHLAAYGSMDIALDPFPHNGGVTSVESLLMGVPVVTLLGDYVCGRVGASIMTTLGFKGAIARTPFEYVSHALATSEETWTFEDRQALRRRVCNSVLMNADVYASAVEEQYRAAWKTYCGTREKGSG